MVRILHRITQLLQQKHNSRIKSISRNCNLSLKVASLHPGPRNDEKNLEKRLKWAQEWMNTDMDFTKNCIFIEESGFDINMRRSRAWSKKGTEAVIPTASTRAVSHTVIGAISAIGVVNITMRVPLSPKKIKIQGGKKRKAAPPKSHKLKVQQLATTSILSGIHWILWIDIPK